MYIHTRTKLTFVNHEQKHKVYALQRRELRLPDYTGCFE